MSMDTLVLLCYVGLLATSVACFFIVIPLTLNILLHSVLLIIIGSVNSVKFMIRDKISRTEWNDDEPMIEVVGKSEAFQFPIVGSIMLFSLYLITKFAGKEIVSLVLVGYFMLIGMESFKGILCNYTFIGKQKVADPTSLKHPVLFKGVKVFGMELSMSKLDLI
jgi:hypothetical protein